MKKYIIHNFYSEDYNAGPKSREDIQKIASELGFEALILRKKYLTGRFKVIRQIFMLMVDLFKIFMMVERKSLILFQVPLPFTRWQAPLINAYFKILKIAKKIKVAIVVIDIETFRNSSGIYMGEWKILEIGDGVILHTDEMREKYLSYGMKGQELELINIFDYLSSFDPQSKKRKLRKQVVFAGNLDVEKAGFLGKLYQLEEGVIFNLYGNPKIEENNLNIKYMGSSPPDQIIEIIDGSFGLVWDGHSIDTCSHEIGQYQRLNCPHKTSLYLAAGLPVIIWKEAAMAKFIEENNLGFTVGSLREINSKIESLTEKEYSEMLENTLKYSEKLREGYFFRRAICNLMDII
jgi:hypothetical protein